MSAIKDNAEPPTLVSASVGDSDELRCLDVPGSWSICIRLRLPQHAGGEATIKYVVPGGAIQRPTPGPQTAVQRG